MRKQHLVRLTAAERATLHHLLASGRAPARRLTRARILLKADQGPDGPAWPDARIVLAVEVSRPTVERVRKRFAQGGLEAALEHRPPRATKPRKLDGAQEAHLVALTCGAPPAGQQRWSLRLLAAKLVELRVVDTVSHETVRQILKQTS
jgi:hypothetical protein